MQRERDEQNMKRHQEDNATDIEKQELRPVEEKKS